MSPRIMLLVLATLSSTAAPAFECDAVAEWERLVSAKGGRPALQKIETLYERTTRTYWMGFKRVTSDIRALYVLPNREWFWRSENGTFIGTYVYIKGYSKGYRLQANDHNWRPRIVREQLAAGEDGNENLVIILLETVWAKPVPASCHTNHDSLVISARLGSKWFTFHVSQKTYLPGRIVVTQDQFRQEYHLDRYKAISGIMLPSRMTMKSQLGSSSWSVEYEVNPRYDPAVLTTEPSVEAGPDAWRAK